MFRRHGDSSLFATTRDIIEIVAILAAGIWAIYVFAYEQRIKPAAEPPSVLLSGSIRAIGVRNGLVQLGYKGSIRNTGQSDVAIIALGFTANGLKYTTQGAPYLNRQYPGTSLYERAGHAGARTLLYRQVELTRFADPAYGSGVTISPGEEVPYSGIFLVRRGEFDAVTLYGSAAYTKVGIAGGYPTKQSFTPDGAVLFKPVAPSSDYHSVEITLDEITLW